VFVAPHTQTELGTRTDFRGVKSLPAAYVAAELIRAIDRTPDFYAASPVYRVLLRLAAWFPRWMEGRWFRPFDTWREPHYRWVVERFHYAGTEWEARRGFHGQEQGAGTQYSHTLSDQTFVYLKRPQMTAVFSVATVLVNGQAGQIVGDDLERVAKFLSVSEGVPLFDLEYGGRLFSRCSLGGVATRESIPFWCDSISLLEASKSDPKATYR